MSVASPSRAAFPGSQAGRHPRLHFRGLLRLHSNYGPLDRSTAQGGLCHRASVHPVTRTNRLPATRSNRQLSGWFLPPLVIRAFWAHCHLRVHAHGLGVAKPALESHWASIRETANAVGIRSRPPQYPCHRHYRRSHQRPPDQQLTDGRNENDFPRDRNAERVVAGCPSDGGHGIAKNTRVVGPSLMPRAAFKCTDAHEKPRPR